MNKMHATRPILTSVDRLRIRFWLSQLVLLIALWGILSEKISDSPILISLTIFLGLSMVFPPIAGWLPRKWMRPFSILLITGVTIDLAIHWEQLLDPILRAGYLILWTRTIFYRTSRESMQLLLLALFLIMLTGVISVSLSYVVQLMLFTPIAMVLLMLNTTKDPEQRDFLKHADWRTFRIRSFMSRILASISWRLLGLVGLSLGFMVISISAIFVILPRFHFRQMMPSISIPGIAKSGFSESFQLGSVHRIMEDNSIAFRVEVPQPSNLPATPYWRMLALDMYQDGRFSRCENSARQLRSPELMTSNYFVSNRMIRNPGHFNGEDWVFYLEGSISRYLPIPGSFRSIQFQSLQWLRVDLVLSTFNIRQTSSQLTTFRLRHVVADETFRSSSLEPLLDDLHWTRIDPRDQAAIRSISYPGSTLTAILTEKDAAFLGSIVEKIITDNPSLAIVEDPIYSYAENVLQYLQEHHQYSLSSTVNTGGSMSRDPVIAWMQAESPGHCEYFAAAAVLLLRANDIPARVVTGFVGGEWNHSKNNFVVRNLNAHAWCEFYTERNGWIRMDPTPASRLQLGFSDFDTNGSIAFEGWLGWFEDLKLNYYRTIIGFDDESQYELITRIGRRLQEANLNLNLGGFGSFLSNWLGGDSSENPTTNLKKERGVWITPTFFFGLLLLFVGLLFIGIRWKQIRHLHLSQTLQFNSTERHYRNKAKQWLKRISSPSDIDPKTWSQLLAIRFGPIQGWDDPDAVFRKIRNQMKHSRRN